MTDTLQADTPEITTELVTEITQSDITTALQAWNSDADSKRRLFEYMDNAIYFSGYTDMEYKIGVTVFAEDSTGSDSRYQEVYVNT